MEHLAQLQQSSGGKAALTQERETKRARLREFLEREGLRGVLLRRHENLSWLTAGQFEARVGLLRESSVGALLVLADGRTFAIVPNNEAPRLEAEELTGLGAESVVRPWHALDFAAESAAIGGEGIACDLPTGNLPAVDLGLLRAPLLDTEVARYRELGRATAAVVAELLPTLEPGMSEYEMEAMVAGRLLQQGILPSVLLMAADERILRFKHAVARGARLQRFGMLNLCARKWGLACSITRFVHFGALPVELARGFDTATRVNAALLHATREGATAGSLFLTAADAYAAAGYPGEEQEHHQGGACGYLEREWVAAPGASEPVRTPEAFAWNPSCRGGKVEDTVLVTAQTSEVLTRTPTLPEVSTEVAGIVYTAAAPLIRT